MFSILYYTVFPALGRFFGILASFATTDTGVVLSYLLPPEFDHPISFVCYNVFNGHRFTLDPMGSGFLRFTRKFLNDKILTPLFDGLGLLDSPFWVSFLILFASVFFAFTMFKFVKSLF